MNDVVDQNPKDFEREIKEKIEKVVPYEKAWNTAIEYVSSFPKDILLDQRGFFKNVYLPIRDDFEKILNKDRKDILVNFFKKDQE